MTPDTFMTMTRTQRLCTSILQSVTGIKSRLNYWSFIRFIFSTGTQTDIVQQLMRSQSVSKFFCYLLLLDLHRSHVLEAQVALTTYSSSALLWLVSLISSPPQSISGLWCEEQQSLAGEWNQHLLKLQKEAGSALTCPPCSWTVFLGPLVVSVAAAPFLPRLCFISPWMICWEQQHFLRLWILCNEVFHYWHKSLFDYLIYWDATLWLMAYQFGVNIISVTSSPILFLTRTFSFYAFMHIFYQEHRNIPQNRYKDQYK